MGVITVRDLAKRIQQGMAQSESGGIPESFATKIAEFYIAQTHAVNLSDVRNLLGGGRF